MHARARRLQRGRCCAYPSNPSLSTCRCANLQEGVEVQVCQRARDHDSVGCRHVPDSPCPPLGLPRPSVAAQVVVPDTPRYSRVATLTCDESHGLPGRQGAYRFRLRAWAMMRAAQSLRAIAGALRRCGPRAAFYLAAAVSDFYIPWSSMVGCVGCSLPCAVLGVWQTLADNGDHQGLNLPWRRLSTRYSLPLMAKS